MRNLVLPYIGTGVGFRGKSFRGKSFRTQAEREEKIAVVTRWFILFWLPVLPLSSWLVRDRGAKVNDFRPDLRNYALISRVPLYWKQVAWILSGTLLAAVVIFFFQRWLSGGEPA